MRLQVYLSHNGVCSRRNAMEIIKAGRVSVDGVIVNEPSFEITRDDHVIVVDGKSIDAKSYVCVMLNKPAGFITTKEDRFADKTILELLPKNLQHLVPVGRLDKDTEGLLLLTNDGDINFALTHPKFNVDKTYFVRARGQITSQEKERLEKGIILDGKKTAPAKISQWKATAQETEFNLTIHEGRKRQIRLMLGKIGHPVLYLQRLKQGPLALGDLPRGKWRFLSDHEINQIKKLQ